MTALEKLRLINNVDRRLIAPLRVTGDKALYLLKDMADVAGIEIDDELLKEANRQSCDWYGNRPCLWFEIAPTSS